MTATDLLSAVVAVLVIGGGFLALAVSGLRAWSRRCIRYVDVRDVGRARGRFRVLHWTDDLPDAGEDDYS